MITPRDLYEIEIAVMSAEERQQRWQDGLVWLAVFLAFVGGCLTGLAVATWNNPGFPRWLGW